MVVRDLRNTGFTSMEEDAYASAIFFLLKVAIRTKQSIYLHFQLMSFILCYLLNVCDRTKYTIWLVMTIRSSVLKSIKACIQAVPLQFLRAILDYLGDFTSGSGPSSGPEISLDIPPLLVLFWKWKSI